MIYFTLAHAADTSCLQLCFRRIRELDPDAKFYVANDDASPADPLPPGCIDLRPDYRRNGGLYTLDTPLGNLATMREILETEHAREIVKLDCDTYINDLTPFSGKLDDYDMTLCERIEPFQPLGSCYGLTYQGITAALDYITGRHWVKGLPYPEDVTTLMACALNGGRVLLHPYTDGKGVGLATEEPTDRHRRAALVHCGEPDLQGRRVDRATVYRRMIALDKYIHGV